MNAEQEEGEEVDDDLCSSLIAHTQRRKRKNERAFCQ
jgi:hypothetical protein